MKVTNTEHTAINGNQSISPIPDKRKGRKDSPYGALYPPRNFCRTVVIVRSLWLKTWRSSYVRELLHVLFYKACAYLNSESSRV